MKRFVFYFALVFLTMGCDIKPDTCKDQSAWTMKIGFYDVTVSGTKRATSERQLSYLKITDDGSVIQNARKVSKIAMALFQEKDSMAFDFTIGKSDTVTLSNTTVNVIYKPDRIFENYKCGFRTNFYLNKIEADTSIFDSITIVQPLITDVYQENCKFYINPSVK